MRETFELPYLPNELEQLLDGDLTTTDFLNAVFSDELGENDMGMRSLLVSYNSNDGGAPEVHNFEIVDEEFNEENLTGEFTTEFTVFYFYPCEDMNSEHEDYVTWKFKINTESEMVEFIGEEQLEREPDAY